MVSVMVSTPSLPSNAASISSSSPTVVVGVFLTGLLVFVSRYMDSACARNCAFLQVEDLVDFGCVDVLDCRVVGVRVVLHHAVEEVSAAVVAKERQDVSAVDILPERRANALGDLGR